MSKFFPTQLEEIRRGGRSVVFRGVDADGRSVVLKQITDEGANGFNDWASLAFLTEIPEAAALVPGFLGGEVTRKAFLMEDLGGSETLDDVLQGSDAFRVRAVLNSLAEVYAHLHVATRDREAEFQRHRTALPGAPLHRRGEAENWLNGGERRQAWSQAVLDIPLPPEFEAACREVAARYADPGPYLVFTHGDPAPTNNHLAGEQVRLLDFEYGAYRHALYDLTAWQMLCPLPTPIVHQTKAAYRAVLAAHLPAAADALAYEEAWATLCAYRGLALLTWVRPNVLEQNHPWAANWTAREAVLAAVTRTAEATRGIEWLRPIHEAAALLQTALQQRFPDLAHSLPRWPALS